MACISVIVPVYKVEQYIHHCVDSILNQSFRDFELILVDDGSPDSCGAICDAYARQDDRVHVLHQQNGGLSAARNAGIDWVFANSDSQWFTFIDSDDWVHRDYLLRLFAVAAETKCALSACRFYRTGGEELPTEPERGIQALQAEDYYCGKDSQENAPMIACAKLYHRSLFETVRYPVGKIHEDEFTTYKLVYKAGKVGVTDERLYAYFQNPVGIMKSGWNPKKLDIVEAVEGQIAFAEAKGLSALMEKVTRHYIYCVYEQLGCAAAWDDPAKKRCVKELRRKLRYALKLGKPYGHLTLSWDNLWVYEEAYPMKPVWWLLYKGQQLAGK